ncbi:MAG: 50S ribosomal protein L5, partial [Syntrophobacterales bacterium RIFOXYC2_FULL_60_23]
MAEKGSGKDKAKTAAKGAPKGADKKAAKDAAAQATKGAEKATAPPAPLGTPRLMEYYRDECVPQMMQEFRYKSPMQVPRLKKVVVNIGLGEAIQNIKLLES